MFCGRVFHSWGAGATGVARSPTITLAAFFNKRDDKKQTNMGFLMRKYKCSYSCIRCRRWFGCENLFAEISAVVFIADHRLWICEAGQRSDVDLVRNAGIPCAGNYSQQSMWRPFANVIGLRYIITVHFSHNLQQTAPEACPFCWAKSTARTTSPTQHVRPPGFCRFWHIRLEQSSRQWPQPELHRSCFQSPFKAFLFARYWRTKRIRDRGPRMMRCINPRVDIIKYSYAKTCANIVSWHCVSSPAKYLLHKIHCVHTKSIYSFF